MQQSNLLELLKIPLHTCNVCVGVIPRYYVGIQTATLHDFLFKGKGRVWILPLWDLSTQMLSETRATGAQATAAWGSHIHQSPNQSLCPKSPSKLASIWMWTLFWETLNTQASKYCLCSSIRYNICCSQRKFLFTVKEHWKL